MISKATVVFGGPAAEHDISILTGLQAERVLSGAGVAVQPVYWSRNDQWYLVPTNLEARDFTEGDGVPSGREAARAADRRQEGQRLLPRGRPRRRQAARDRPGPELLPRRGRRVRRRAGAVRAARHQGHRRHRRRGGAGHGQARLRRRDGGGRRPVPEAHPAVGGREAAVRRPLHRQAAVRRLLDRHRGGRGLGDRGRAARHLPGPARGRGRRAEPAGPLRPQHLGPHRADPGRLRDREAAAPRRRRDLLLRREVPPSRGPLGRAPRVPRRHLARAARHHPVPRHAASSS